MRTYWLLLIVHVTMAFFFLVFWVFFFGVIVSKRNNMVPVVTSIAHILYKVEGKYHSSKAIKVILKVICIIIIIYVMFLWLKVKMFLYFGPNWTNVPDRKGVIRLLELKKKNKGILLAFLICFIFYNLLD